MEILEVGSRIKKFEGAEGVTLNITDGGLILAVRFRNPSSSEMEEFKQNKRFEIRFLTLKNVMVFTVKIGELEWLDAPYSPHLSETFSFPVLTKEGGLALNLILADSSDGEIVSLRLIGTSYKFSTELIKEVNKLKEMPFNEKEYDKNIQEIFEKYSTKVLASMSKNYYKMK